MYTPDSPRRTELRWRPARHFTAAELGPRERTSLLDEGSLTARLQAACGNRLRVVVLRQEWQRPLLAERRALGLRHGQWAMVREVLLECAGEPWVHARSVLPAAILQGELRHLRRFGTRSLGALLFADPRLRRTPFEIARVAPGGGLLAPEAPLAQAAWARRSQFRLGRRALLVQELFLPACWPGLL